MKNLILVREAEERDRQFIFELSPNLAEVSKLDWHTDDVVQKMQDDYISEMLAVTLEPNATFIAKSNNVQIGFIHIRTHKYDISGKTCGTIPLLAVSPKSQGLGVGYCIWRFFLIITTQKASIKIWGFSQKQFT